MVHFQPALPQVDHVLDLYNRSDASISTLDQKSHISSVKQCIYSVYLVKKITISIYECDKHFII